MNAPKTQIDASANKLVEARIADAQQNLTRINDLVERAAERRKVIDKTYLELSGLKNKGVTASLNAQVMILEAVLDSLPFGTYQRAAETLKRMREDLATLNRTIDQLTDELKIEKSCWHPQQSDDHRTWTQEFVEKKLQKFRFLAAQRDVGFGERLASVEKNKPVWGEHIEAVTGLLLRDGRFDGPDGQLCKFADALIEICKKETLFKKKTLNVLGHESPELRELNRVVYVRFPAWSVWALPLTVHEFWHAAGSPLYKSHESVTQRVTKENPEQLYGSELDRAWRDETLQDCLADAFSVYVMGPGYAYTAILLSLSPFKKRHRRRAEAVFEALHYMEQLERADGVHYATADLNELKHCWSSACSSFAKSDAGSNGSEVQQNEREKYRTWVQLILKSLKEEAPHIRYNVEVWAGYHEDWPRILSTDNAGDETKILDQLLSSENTDIRHALHAGWIARWANPSLSDKIAKRINECCVKLLAREPGETSGPRNENAHNQR